MPFQRSDGTRPMQADWTLIRHSSRACRRMAQCARSRALCPSNSSQSQLFRVRDNRGSALFLCAPSSFDWQWLRLQRIVIVAAAERNLVVPVRPASPIGEPGSLPRRCSTRPLPGRRAVPNGSFRANQLALLQLGKPATESGETSRPEDGPRLIVRRSPSLTSTSEAVTDDSHQARVRRACNLLGAEPRSQPDYGLRLL